MQRLARIGIGLLFLLISASGGVAQNGAAAPADEAAAHLRLEKFNKAVDALNFASSWIDRSFAGYASAVDLAQGPSGHERPTIIPTSGALDALKNLEQFFSAKPGTEPIDALARRYALTGEAVIPLLDNARLYYSQQDYKDDGYAKGRAMHGPLVAAYGDFHNAALALRAEARRFADEQRDKELASLRGEGRMVRYDVMLDLKEARQTLEFIGAELREKHDAAKIDSDALKLKNDAMDGTLNDLRGLKTSDPSAIAREFPRLAASSIDEYIRVSEEFLKGAKYVQRAIRDHQPISPNDFEYGGGRPGDIIQRYNAIVRQANYLNQ